MRIVVDLQCCQNASRVRGIGRYALAMTRALASVGTAHEWLVVLSDRFPETIDLVRAELAGTIAAGAIRVCALPGRIAAAEPASAWRCRAAQIVWTEYLASLDPDLVFVPSLFEGFHDDVAVSLDGLRCPVAVTVHDFIPLEEPGRYLPTSEDEVAYHRRLRELRRADLILAISEHSAGLAAGLVGLDPARIVVAPNGVDPAIAALAAAASADTPARLGIDRPFVLNTSPIEHRKNVQGLIAAFGLVDPAVRDRHQLVVAGRIDEAGRRHVAALAAAAGLPADAIVTTGHLTEADLAALYGQCAVFAFPSFSEGFGLPPLEAMACGAAVIAADATSLPEVIGRRDMLVDPADPAALAAAIGRVLTDPDRRADLSSYGVERARRFSWEGAARTALAAFERLGTVARAAPSPPADPPTRAAIVLPERDDPMLRGKAATIAALLPGAVTIDLVGGGDTPDPMLDAVVERRTLDWFDRHVLAMDAIVYVTAGAADAAFEQRMAVHRGIVVSVDGWWLRSDPGTSQPPIAVGPGGHGDLEVLPVAPSPIAARAWRADMGLAADTPLAVTFVAPGAGASAPTGMATHAVTADPLAIAGNYRMSVTAADLLRTAGSVTPSLLAQLQADAHHLGIPLDTPAPPAGSMPHGRPAATSRGGLASWSAALEAASTAARPALPARVARRLPKKVHGVGPAGGDLADLSRSLAANAVVEQGCCTILRERIVRSEERSIDRTARPARS